ncbi:F-box/kelch-repeat protein [Salix suchowensis]|nr:F-box/kelch-repeat protein [Salix suchowensis]
MTESAKKNRVPEDVMMDILIALPIKSILRFRCLSKSWNSLITDKNFINAYLAQAKPLLLLRRCEAGCFDIIGSCNGVVCLSDIDHQGRTKSLILWNPTIRKHLNLPLPKLCGPHSATWGFGFDLSSDDYKFQVFSLKRRSWERINYRPALGPFCVAPEACKNSGYCNQVAFNGILHWLVYREENDSRHSFVLSFDLSNDKFGEIMLPQRLARVDIFWMVISEFDDSLAALFYRRDAKSVDVWFMREYGVRNSWDRLYRIQVDGFTRAMVFRKNGEILMTKHGSDEVVSCNPRTQASRNFGNLGLRRCDHAEYFVQSLSLLNESNEIDSRGKKKKQKVRITSNLNDPA